MRASLIRAWLPPAVLAFGALLTASHTRAQQAASLRAPLRSAIPQRVEDHPSRDIALSADEERVAGVTSYLVRAYLEDDTPSARIAFSLYVGYYDRQTQGRTIHSPRNCLPGGGWEPLTSSRTSIETGAGPAVVNRYLLQRGTARLLVLYWYQGRGRVAANEYAVKWDLLRDAAVHKRTEEALVRIMVPVDGTEGEAFALGQRVAATIVPALNAALPQLQ